MEIEANHDIANENIIQNQTLVENIKKIISKIRNQHSRPCYQKICTSLNRAGYNTEMDSLKEVF